MRFVARVYPSHETVVIVREDGKVRTVGIYTWKAYLGKCKSTGLAYLCKRSIILGDGELYVGIVTRESPMPSDLERLKPLVERFGIPEFALDDALALMHMRDALIDLSCIGCESGQALLARAEAPA